MLAAISPLVTPGTLNDFLSSVNIWMPYLAKGIKTATVRDLAMLETAQRGESSNLLCLLYSVARGGYPNVITQYSVGWKRDYSKGCKLRSTFATDCFLEAK